MLKLSSVVSNVKWNVPLDIFSAGQLCTVIPPLPPVPVHLPILHGKLAQSLIRESLEPSSIGSQVLWTPLLHCGTPLGIRGYSQRRAWQISSGTLTGLLKGTIYLSDLKVAIIHPGCELLHVKNVSQVAIASLGAHPTFCPSFIPTTIQEHDCRGMVLHVDIQEQIRELLINRSPALLPFGFDDEIVRPPLRMIGNEVTVLLRAVDALSRMELLSIDGLPQDTGGSEACPGDEGVPAVIQAREDKPLQDGSCVIGLRTTLNRVGHGA